MNEQTRAALAAAHKAWLDAGGDEADPESVRAFLSKITRQEWRRQSPGWAGSVQVQCGEGEALISVAMQPGVGVRRIYSHRIGDRTCHDLMEGIGLLLPRLEV